MKLGKQWVTRQFLYVPNSPKLLLRRGLFENLEAEIKFKNGELKILIPETKRIEAAALLLTGCLPKAEDYTGPSVMLSFQSSGLGSSR